MRPSPWRVLPGRSVRCRGQGPRQNRTRGSDRVVDLAARGRTASEPRNAGGRLDLADLPHVRDLLLRPLAGASSRSEVDRHRRFRAAMAGLGRIPSCPEQFGAGASGPGGSNAGSRAVRGHPGGRFGSQCPGEPTGTCDPGTTGVDGRRGRSRCAAASSLGSTRAPRTRERSFCSAASRCGPRAGRCRASRAARVQDLLGYLLLFHDRDHHREMLADALWAGLETPQARKYLRQALWQLQSTVVRVVSGDPLLIVEPDRITGEP